MTAAALEGALRKREREEIPDEPLLIGDASDRALNEQLLQPKPRSERALRIAFVVSGAGTLMLFVLLLYTATTGIGVWGNNIPVAWAFGIINFVWWIGIGHAGTFISAVLLLLQQKWRTSINRFAEAMTLFAVVNAAIFPLFHLGRPWFAYWLVPYPSTMRVWPQFRSALPWDFAAISTYGTISFFFWYTGLIPDLAALRDSPSLSRTRRFLYGIFALGFRGSTRQWAHFRVAYLLLAGLATPLVVSVHSIVSTDFAESQLPGWHSPIFPPYFVAGAIFSGFAMVLTLLIPARRLFGIQNVVTKKHLSNIAFMLLVTSWILVYAYGIETFVSWYTGNRFERYVMLVDRPFGPYAVVYWTMLFCNCVVPQLFWSKRMRTNELVLFVASILVNVGMYAERFLLIVSSQHADFLPSSWSIYRPTVIDGGIFFGTLCFFTFLFLAFLRLVPFVSVSELKELRHELEHHEKHQKHAREGHAHGAPVAR